jgi:hypothetical protein
VTDNGLAALATAIHVGRNHQHDPRADERPHAHLISEREQEEAAAILGPRGVFLPDGLPEVSIKGLLEDFDGAPYPEDFQRAVAVREADYLGQIATLRAAPQLTREQWDDTADALDTLCTYEPEMEVNRERWRTISAMIRAALAARHGGGG